MALTENPKLALIPSGYKASKVYSVLPSDGVGDFDFSRSGSATRINKDGLIETVSSNVPRLNYPLIDGVVSGCPSLLLEPQSTNYVTYSQELNNSDWSTTRLDVLANQIISPDGTLNADLLTPTASALDHSIGKVSLINYNSQESTVSFFAKFNGYNISISLAGTPTNWTGCIFDLENGIARTPQNSGAQSLCTSKIEDYGDGWYRCSVTFTPYSSGTFYTFWGTVDSLDANLGSYGLQSYTSDGISGVYLWGCQSEVGQSYLTSYIPTTTQAVTRSAETCNNAGDAATFNDSEGVLMAEISALADDGTTRQIDLSYLGSNTDYVRLEFATTSNLIYGVIKNTTQQAALSYTVPNSTDLNKIAIKYKTNDFSLFVNGFKVDTDTNGTTPSNLNDLSMQSTLSANPFRGNTKQIQYFDTALTDTDLEELTSWTSFNEMAQSQLYSIQ